MSESPLMLLAYDMLYALRRFGFGVVYVEKGNHRSKLFNPNEPDEWARVVDPKMPPKIKHVWMMSEPLR